MTITWKNVNSPNFSSANNLLVQGGRGITEGFKGIVDYGKNVRANLQQTKALAIAEEQRQIENASRAITDKGNELRNLNAQFDVNNQQAVFDLDQRSKQAEVDKAEFNVGTQQQLHDLNVRAKQAGVSVDEFKASKQGEVYDLENRLNQARASTAEFKDQKKEELYNLDVKNTNNIISNRNAGTRISQGQLGVAQARQKQTAFHQNAQRQATARRDRVNTNFKRKADTRAEKAQNIKSLQALEMRKDRTNLKPQDFVRKYGTTTNLTKMLTDSYKGKNGKATKASKTMKYVEKQAQNLKDDLFLGGEAGQVDTYIAEAIARGDTPQQISDGLKKGDKTGFFSGFFVDTFNQDSARSSSSTTPSGVPTRASISEELNRLKTQ